MYTICDTIKLTEQGRNQKGGIKMEVIKEFLEMELGIEDAELIEQDWGGLKFTGWTEDEEDEDKEVEIFVGLDNRVYIDGKEVDVCLPFNVWSAVER